MRFLAFFVCFAYLSSVWMIQALKSFHFAVNEGWPGTDQNNDNGVIARHRRAIFNQPIGDPAWAEVAPVIKHDFTKQLEKLDGLALPELMKKLKNLPKIIIFDLNHTLWPFEIGSDNLPPFHKNDAGRIVDFREEPQEFYPEVSKVFKFLEENNLNASLASKTDFDRDASKLLKLLDFKKHLTNMQMYREPKHVHLNRISNKSNVSARDMLFFDDKFANIQIGEHMGIISELVKNGMSMDVLLSGLKMFHLKREMDKNPPA